MVYIGPSLDQSDRHRINSCQEEEGSGKRNGTTSEGQTQGAGKDPANRDGSQTSTQDRKKYVPFEHLQMFLLRKMGHLARDCRTRPLASETACFSCGKEVHFSRDCPDQPNREGRVSMLRQFESILKPSVTAPMELGLTGPGKTPKVVRFALTTKAPVMGNESKFHEQIARMTIYLQDISHQRDAILDTGASISVIGQSHLRDIPHRLLSSGNSKI